MRLRRAAAIIARLLLVVVAICGGVRAACAQQPAAGTVYTGQGAGSPPKWLPPSGGGPLFQGRLTLASGVPVMGPTSCGGSPCASQSTIYYDCYTGNAVTYFNGSSDVTDTVASCEVSDAMASTGTGVINGNDTFDVWWVHSGANRICIATNGSGAGWSGDTGGSTTARGTGYSQLNRAARGYLTNANALTHCYNGSIDYGSVSANRASYLGTIFATTGSPGTVHFIFGGAASGGSFAALNLWNYYNRVLVSAAVTDTGGAYTYTSSTIRQARASATDAVFFVIGVSEDQIQASYFTWLATAAATNAFPKIGLGLDATNSFSCSAATVFAPSALTYVNSALSSCALTPGVGLHTISANEQGDGTNANTFQDNGVSILSVSARM